MKRLTMNFLLAAAAVTAGAVSASAQSMKAEVPFSFHAGSKLMPAGAYTVQMEYSAGSPRVALHNVDSGKAMFLPVAFVGEPARAWKDTEKARIQFDCAESRCVVRQVWPGSASVSYHIAGPNFGRHEAVRTTEIGLTRVTGD